MAIDLFDGVTGFGSRFGMAIFYALILTFFRPRHLGEQAFIRRFKEGFHMRFIVAAPDARILDLNAESAHDNQGQIREIL
ncbi:hypothetical protein D3C78_1842620 [compost metagenome]